MCKKIKSQLCAPAGIASRQHRLEGFTVGGGPGTVLKYIYTHTHTRVRVCVCVCVCDLQGHAKYFMFGLKCFVTNLYKMHCTP